MKTFFATTLLLLSVLFVNAQSGPQFPELKVKEDYAKAAPMFLQATEWLNETPLNEQLELRKRTNAFILTWVMGSPDVNINLGDPLIGLMKDNPQLYPIYLGNYASFCINNKDNKNPRDGARAGLQGIVNAYKKGVGIKKTKQLKKFAEAVDSGNMEESIDELLSKDIHERQ